MAFAFSGRLRLGGAGCARYFERSLGGDFAAEAEYSEYLEEQGGGAGRAECSLREFHTVDAVCGL